MRAIILLGILCSFLTAQPREALLIGNHIYTHQSVSNLKDPLKHLNKLKKTLEDLDFNVKIKTNLDSVNLEEAIELFSKRLRAKKTIGFLYYTGHGCQVEGKGYLLPTNINSSKRLKVKHHALKISEMIEKLKESGNDGVNMFFLDACRDVPVGTKGTSKSLGQIKNTPKGTLVVYATENGKTAEDNSDFINSIISSIKEPKQNIRNLPYSISDTFKRGTTSQMPIFSAVDIPKIVLNTKGGYVPPVVFEQEFVPIPLPKPKPSPTSKWLKPSSSTCTQNGGKMVNGVCEANWKNVKKICRANGGTLPTRNDFKREVEACGGTWKDWRKNSENSSYQSYSRQKGFSSYSWTSEEEDSSNAWGVDFNLGGDGRSLKTVNGYALCVR